LARAGEMDFLSCGLFVGFMVWRIFFFLFWFYTDPKKNKAG
jgi:hypothetical protein